LFDHERQLKILELLETNQRVRVSALSESFGVSEATVRRDLEKLQELGRIQRTHGGAILAERASPEPPVLQRTAVNAEEKRRIGQKAATFVRDGETVFIGSGTTTLEVARNLVVRRNLTVITNALTVVNALAQADGIASIVTGGLLRPSEFSFVGHITDLALQELRPQKVIMGIRAISLPGGLTNDYMPEVSTDRVIIRSAPEVILVADHTKFGKISTAFVAPITAVHRIITDSKVPEEVIESIRALGVDVDIV